jgi:hypothetical protein
MIVKPLKISKNYFWRRPRREVSNARPRQWRIGHLNPRRGGAVHRLDRRDANRGARAMNAYAAPAACSSGGTSRPSSPFRCRRRRGSGNRGRHGDLRALCAGRGLAAARLEERSPGKDDAGAAESLARLPTCYLGTEALGEGVDAGHSSPRHSLLPSPQTSSAHASASVLLTIPVSNR